MKQTLKKIIPKVVLDFYHLFLARLAGLWYGFPSDQLIVIGVTGTNGKSTTVNLIARILEEAGHKVGLTSTVNFQIGNKVWLNNLKMTMPGRFLLQKLLRDMVRAGCSHAVIETSSEGIAQFRHVAINYDVLTFTNLTAEHLASHGGFANYKSSKLKVFRALASSPHKHFARAVIPKVIAANLDDSHGRDFLVFAADKKITYSIRESSDFQGTDIRLDSTGLKFEVAGVAINLQLLGKFDVYNSLAAIASTNCLGVSVATAKIALEKVTGVPGRMERIDAGQDFWVLVDYAPEPTGLHHMYETILEWPHSRIIHILGSTGGGRDKSRRAILGYIAGSKADIVIVTNEDPYDDDPQEIIDDVAKGALQARKKLGENLFKILDRREAIAFSLKQAQANDLVVITGKGAEQAMVVRSGRKVPWDDREVVREELTRLLSESSPDLDRGIQNN